ncbi:MAG: response regulator transcription factor, partial [Leeuwenhoekiella sp.]
FRTGELLARIRSAIKHNQTQDNQTTLTFDTLEIDLVSRTVKNHGNLIKFTSTEYNLYALFAKNEGKVLTHHYILREIWGIGYQTETQYLRVFVAAIRKKIEENPNNPLHIITESGVGYRFQ